MEEVKLIKLRQAEANEVDINGSYKVTLAEPILLEEGDQVTVKSVILDTATESVVTLDNDVNVVMGVAKYLRYYNASQYALTATPLPYFTPDLKIQTICTRLQIGANGYNLGFIVVNPSYTRQIGPFETTWEYTELGTGKKRTHPILVGPFKARDHLSKNILITVGWLVEGKNFRCTDTPATLRRHGIEPFISEQDVVNKSQIELTGNGGWVWLNNGSPIPSGSDVLNVHEELCEFTIPKGSYEPAEIAQIVNDNMVKIDSLGVVGDDYARNVYPLNNPFLSTFAQQSHKIGLLGADMFFCPESTASQQSPASLLKITTVPTTLGTDVFVGGNQVSMNYDLNLKKLNFDSLHMPIYIGPGTPFQPGITFPSDPLPKEIQVSQGGNFFTRLEPADFWLTLGFQGVTVRPTNSTDFITLTDTSTVFPLIINLELGKNIIGALPTVDVLVPKTATYLTPTLEGTINSFTTPILASRQFDVTENDEGYYLLEVGIKLPQKMIGGYLKTDDRTGSNKVQSIITKYFTSGNFLQESGAGSIVYTHIGDPELLSDFDVRVLHPDFSVPNNNELGDKNSVFLEIVKAFKPPDLSQMKLK